jgi:hypothetical protein
MGGFRGDRNSFDNPDESPYKRNEEGSDHQEGKKCIVAVGRFSHTFLTESNSLVRGHNEFN